MKNALLSGVVSYLPRIGLPADAVLSVALQDVSMADTAAIELASHRRVIGDAGLAFQLSYAPSLIQSGHTYVLSARIEKDGALYMISKVAHKVDFESSDNSSLSVIVELV